MFQKLIAELLSNHIEIDEQTIISLIEIPPDSRLGDYAFPCFSLAKALKKSPNDIAKGIAEKIKPITPIIEIKASGPYVNFFIDKNKIGISIINEIQECGSCYGSQPLKNEKIMVEFPAPNTNKPLHLGHVRNMLLGNSICSIIAFAGYQAIPVDLVNDRGVHICKSMLAYKKWGENREPDKKTDHFVGDFYVLYAKNEKDHPELEEETRDMLLKWEEGDKETLALWEKMRQWSLVGIHETYKKLEVFHKKTYYESDLYKDGKGIVLEGLKRGIFEKDKDGAIIADLQEYGYGKKVLLREDGTSVYMTQDFATAKAKFDDFHMDKSVYVVANEQNHHFKVLFKIFELMKLPYANKCIHLNYGMIALPEGRMKSREGTVVDADDLIAEMESMASEEIVKRHKDLDESEIKMRAGIIGMGALKFYILKYDPQKDFVYNPEESISFEGETGPYVQYAHARICSILRQAKDYKPKSEGLLFSHDKEHKIITKLAGYKAAVNEAAVNYKPSVIARYALELAQSFNEFYQECPVLKADDLLTVESRLALILTVKIVLASALDLLGIKAPEEM